MKHCLMVFVLCALGCSAAKPADPRQDKLHQASAVVAKLARSQEMRELAAEEGKVLPSALVSAMFSDVGAAMWPVKGYFPEGEEPRGEIYPPEGISISPDRPEAAWSVRVVPDDAKKVIVVEGYGDNLSEPLVRDELNVPEQAR